MTDYLMESSMGPPDERQETVPLFEDNDKINSNEPRRQLSAHHTMWTPALGTKLHPRTGHKYSRNKRKNISLDHSKCIQSSELTSGCSVITHGLISVMAMLRYHIAKFCSKGLDYSSWISILALLSSVLTPGIGAMPYKVSEPAQYGVVIDAGSSGSRVRVYGYIRQQMDKLPSFGEAFSYRVKPGISSFNSDKTPLSGLDNYFNTLLDKAKDFVPEVQIYDTPIYVMATAGR